MGRGEARRSREAASRKPGSRRFGLRVTVGALALVALLLLAGCGCGSSSDESSQSGSAQVPDVTGMTALDAIHALQAVGLLLGDVENSPDAAVPALTVLGQAPAAGQQADVGSSVSLTVSSGSELVATPDLTGMTADRAKQELADLGLKSYTTTAYDDKVPGDTVAGQLPEAGTGVTLGATVGLLVSKGKAPQKVPVPNVVNKTRADAVSAIQKAGLKSNTIDVYNSSRKAGTVVGQSPSGGAKVSPGSTVDVLVSRGAIPSYVSVPNVTGRSQSSAVSTLSSAGLKASVQNQNSDTVAKGTVIAQFPSAGTKVAPGADVGVMVSLGPASSQPPAPQTVKVPDVTGTSQDSATQKLRQAGFTVKTVNVPTDDAGSGTVVQQFPAAGTTVLKGSEVLIGVARAVPTPY